MTRYQLIKWDDYNPVNSYGPNGNHIVYHLIEVYSPISKRAIVCGPHAAERSEEYLNTREERLKELENSVLRR